METKHMNHQTTELYYWLTLTQMPEIGIAQLKKWLSYFGSVEHICKATSSDLQQCRLNEAQIDAIQHPNQYWIERTLQWQENENHHVIVFTDERYPRLLSEIDSPP